MSSKRLPGKMFKDIAGIPLYKYVYRRCQQAKGVDKVILATSIDISDNPLFESAIKDEFNVYRGPLDNVLKRYVSCAKKAGAKIIIRICGDSPFVDIRMIEELISHLIENNLEYVCLQKHKCVYGLDSEVVTLSTLEKILKLTNQPDDIEHVTCYIRKNPQNFKTKCLEYDLDPFDGNISLTVDTADDLKFCNRVAKGLVEKIGSYKFDFTTKDIFNIIENIKH